jgi:Zn-dependent M28 family amino/carboxypeptidase
MLKCEGSWQGEPLEKQMKAELSEIKEGMESDIEYLQSLGPRNSENDESYKQLRQCEEWIKQKWESQGYAVKKQTFSYKGKEYSNLEIEIKGRTLPAEIIIISAQYDTLPDSPGANNNGSGIAILFQLSQLLRKHTPDRTLRLLNFVNEEDPLFGTEMMGSYQYAKRSHQLREDIKVMLSMDALGIYKDEPGSQRLPFPFSLFYPDRGNFLAFIGNLYSRKYVKETTKGFKKGSSFPIQAGVAPEWAKGAAWSDHSSFWKFGYPGIMVTDTGGFRSPSHTTKEDTMEKLNFDAMSRIAIGMYASVVHLTSP